MVNDDVVKCPLCGGFSHIEQPNLLAALRDPPPARAGREVHYGLLKSPVEELSGVGVQAGHDFQKDVHSWNPCVPMWRRSPKE